MVVRLNKTEPIRVENTVCARYTYIYYSMYILNNQLSITYDHRLRRVGYLCILDMLQPQVSRINLRLQNLNSGSEKLPTL
jgi:hypothetical protein